MSLNNYISRQFNKPTGFGGRIVTAIMNNQNRPMYEAKARLLSPQSGEHIEIRRQPKPKICQGRLNDIQASKIPFDEGFHYQHRLFLGQFERYDVRN